MKIITTTNVSDPNVQQPFLAPSLDFLQGGVREILNALAQGLYGNNAANYIAIYGCEQTLSGGNYDYSAGYIYNVASGQIFFVPAATGLISNPYVHLVTTQATFDPVTFSNGATFSVHYNYTYAMNNSATGSIFRYAQISFVGAQAVPLTIGGGGGNPAFQTNFTVDVSEKLCLWKDSLGYAHLQGTFKATATNTGAQLVFNMPADYVPFTSASVGLFITINEITTSTVTLLRGNIATDPALYIYAPQNNGQYSVTAMWKTI